MSIRPVTYYVAVCDGCGKDCEYEWLDITAFATVEAASVAVGGEAWVYTQDDERHWCSNCQRCEEKHVDEGSGCCVRCGEHLECH